MQKGFGELNAIVLKDREQEEERWKKIKDDVETIAGTLTSLKEKLAETPSDGNRPSVDFNLMASNIHRLVMMINPPNKLPDKDKDTGRYKIGDFLFPLNHVHDVQKLDLALKKSLEENQFRENCKFFMDLVSTLE